MKKQLTIFAVLLLLASLVTMYGTATPTLSSDDVIDIALADQEVSDWVTEMDAKPYDPQFLESDGLWTVIFAADANYTEYELVVIIDDSTSAIVDRYYSASSYDPGYQDQEVLAALDYIKTNQTFADLFAQIPNEMWWGYTYDGYVYLYGNNYYTDTYDYATVILSYQQINTEYHFSLQLIEANFPWGTPSYSLTEMNSKVMNNSAVQEFIALYENYTLNTVLTYSTGTLPPNIYNNQDYPVGYSYTFYFNNYVYYVYDSYESGSVTNVSAPRDFCYCGGSNYGWLTVTVDDASGTITQIAGTTTNQLTRETVLEIVSNDTDFSSWLSTLDNYDIYAYFDGYDTWYVNIYSYATLDWGYAYVNDSNGTIVDSYIFIPIPATRSESEIVDLFLGTSQMQNWIESVNSYEYYAYYDGQGNWWVSIYDPIIYQNYAYGSIDDVTGQVSNFSSHLVTPPKMSVNDVYAILHQSRFENFLKAYPDAYVSVHYYYQEIYCAYDQTTEPGFAAPCDTGQEGQWYVYIYSPSIVEAYIFLTIDDTTGSIIEESSHQPDQLPQLSNDDVESLIADNEVYQSFAANYSIAYHYVYYYQGMWYGWYEGHHADGYYYYFTITIDDANQTVVDAVISPYLWYAAEDMAEGAMYRERSAQANNYPTADGIPLSEALASDKASPFPLALDGFTLAISLCAVASTMIVRKRRKS